MLLQKQRMRAGGRHLGQVRLDGSECLVFVLAEERCKLPAVDAIVIDLLVVEPCGADELVRPELRQERCPQARIGRQRPILGKPLGERPGAEGEAKTFLEVGGNLLTGVAAIVARERIKDDGQGKGFAFSDLRSEDPVAVMASPELDGFELFVAPAFPGDPQAMAVEAAFTLIADERQPAACRGDMATCMIGNMRAHREQVSAME